MKTFLITAATLAALTLPHAAQAQNNTMTGAAGGAVAGAIVGGPVGAVIGGAIGGTVGASADAQQNREVVVEQPAARERTCVVENGIERCREVIR